MRKIYYIYDCNFYRNPAFKKIGSSNPVHGSNNGKEESTASINMKPPENLDPFRLIWNGYQISGSESFKED